MQSVGCIDLRDHCMCMQCNKIAGLVHVSTNHIICILIKAEDIHSLYTENFKCMHVTEFQKINHFVTHEPISLTRCRFQHKYFKYIFIFLVILCA